MTRSDGGEEQGERATHPSSPVVLAVLLELVQGRILRRESGPERLLDDVHGDHVRRGLKMGRGQHNALMEDCVGGNLATFKACFVSDNRALKRRSLHVCIVRLRCSPGIWAGLSVRSQKIKVQVDQGLDFSLRED